MASIQEVAVTSCINDPAISVYMWDVQTGSSLMTYRGDTPITSAGISILKGQYVITALQDKPFLRMWPINSQQPLTTTRLVCPGKVTHAQASPDSCYIALTVAEKLHIYQIASGQLVGSGVRHFQPVRVIRWSSDGSRVVCGGEDGLVTVWSLAALTIPQSSPEPQHVLADHTLPVTDVAVTTGPRPRLISVSADRTCKIYDLHEGSLLVSVVFDSILTAVTPSVLETDVFVGTDSGAIVQLSLLSPPRHLEYHLTQEAAPLVFTGHSKAVRSLSASLNGELLLSGSADGTVKVWHISSRQCLRTLTHKGSVTNAFFTIRPVQLFDNELKPSVVVNPFITTNINEIDCVEVITEQSLSISRDPIRSLFPKESTSRSNDEKVKSLEMEIDLLRNINSNLYKFTVQKLIGKNALPLDSSEVVREPEEKAQKKKKNNNSVVKGTYLKANQKTVKHIAKNKVDTSSLTTTQVNGFPKNRKRKRQNRKNRNKMKNTN